MSDRSHSKFLSYVLRHHPEAAGLELAPGGWVEIDALLAGCAAAGRTLTRTDLDRIVVESDKQRFALSPDGLRVRANQGHSVGVELGLPALEPPAELFHGTVAQFLPSIREKGLIRGQRDHVHLSADLATAQAVGGRRGKPVILVVDAARMFAEGQVFHRSENGVWLVAAVPARFLSSP